jgi:hypothetical protein
MKNSLTIIFSLSIIFIVVSSVTAIPYENSKSIVNKIEKIEDIISIIEDKNNIIITSSIGKLFGLIFMFAGIIGLIASGFLFFMAWLALHFSPMGFMILGLSIISALISLIFIKGGLFLQTSDDSRLNSLIILTFSTILIIVIGILIKTQNFPSFNIDRISNNIFSIVGRF